MTARLKHVDPTREPGIIVRSYAAFAATRFARFISRHINWKLDPLLLRATRGRIATTLVFPTALLETKGARSGASRRNAIIYFHDADRVTIVASNAGDPRHPAWYHNLRKHPAGEIAVDGTTQRFRAVEAEGEQRARIWREGLTIYPGWSSYEKRARHRRIAVFVLEPHGS